MAQKQKTPEIIDEQLYQDEELVWWGQPVASYTLRRINWMQVIMPCFIIAFAIFFINMTQSMFADSRSFGTLGVGRDRDFFDTIFPLFFLAVPLFMIAGAGWAATEPLRKWYASTQTYYALTNKRAIIITKLMSTNVQSFYDEQMKQLRVTMYGNGVGDVIFATNQVTRTYTRGNHGRVNINFSEDGPQFSTGPQQHNVTYNVPQGFLAVPDARVVEDFIAQMFFDDDDGRKKK